MVEFNARVRKVNVLRKVQIYGCGIIRKRALKNPRIKCVVSKGEKTDEQTLIVAV